MNEINTNELKRRLSLASSVDGGAIGALVFDFDGLLVDTETPALQAWTEIYAEYGVHFPLARWAATLGGATALFDAAAYLGARSRRAVEVAAVRARRLRRKVELVQAQPLMPGAASYLDDAARLGLRVGVASSSDREWVAGHLARLGVLDRFDVVVTADNVERVKPVPDLYLAAAAALGVAPAQAVALEDAPNGILAAKCAGLWAVAVPSPLTRDLPLEAADVRISSLAAVPLETLLARLSAVAVRSPTTVVTEQRSQ